MRQARTLLQERGSNAKVHQALKKILAENTDITRKLRALWTLHVTDGLSEVELGELLNNANEHIRSWAIQLLTENKNVSAAILGRFNKMAKSDTSAMVRLYLVSGILRLEPSNRWEVLEALTQKPEDATDHNLPLMLWYAAEPLATEDAIRLKQMAMKAKIPTFQEMVYRRLDELNKASK